MDNNIYQEMFSFILELQEEDIRGMDELLAESKELEHKIRQRELMLEKQEKNRIPNISMFSPLDSADTLGISVEWKDELENWKNYLPELQEKCKQQKERIEKYIRLKNFFLQLEPHFSSEQLKEEEISRKIASLEKEKEQLESIVPRLTALVHKMELCTKLLDVDLVRSRLELQSMTENIKGIVTDFQNGLTSSSGSAVS